MNPAEIIAVGSITSPGGNSGLCLSSISGKIDEEAEARIKKGHSTSCNPLLYWRPRDDETEYWEIALNISMI
jgi:hypothetical protein